MGGEETKPKTVVKVKKEESGVKLEGVKKEELGQRKEEIKQLKRKEDDGGDESEVEEVAESNAGGGGGVGGAVSVGVGCGERMEGSQDVEEELRKATELVGQLKLQVEKMTEEKRGLEGEVGTLKESLELWRGKAGELGEELEVLKLTIRTMIKYGGDPKKLEECAERGLNGNKPLEEEDDIEVVLGNEAVGAGVEDETGGVLEGDEVENRTEESLVENESVAPAFEAPAQVELKELVIKLTRCDSMVPRSAEGPSRSASGKRNRRFRCGDCAKAYRSRKQLIRHQISLHDFAVRRSSRVRRNRAAQLQKPNASSSGSCAKTQDKLGKTGSSPGTTSKSGKSSQKKRGHSSSSKASGSGPHAILQRDSSLPGFKCVCGHTSQTRKDIQWHLRRSNRAKVFKCHLCDAKFGDHTALKRHVVRKHKVEYPGAKFGCGTCGQVTFHTEAQLQSHRRTEH